MSFFISDALAQATPTLSQPGWEGMVFPLGILLFFYIAFIRPQSKRSKEQKQMLSALDKGSEVVTSGGILGKVVELDDNFVKLEVSENNFLQVQRHQIANMMPKGTYKVLNNKKPKI
ncbi:MAG: preprotein translocase subunit YajC [Methylomonas sp.]|jgi:preprotein translocase subunit YajC